MNDYITPVDKTEEKCTVCGKVLSFSLTHFPDGTEEIVYHCHGDAGEDEKGPETGDLRPLNTKGMVLIMNCVKCGGIRTDETRRHCIFCVLKWLVNRPMMRQKAQSGKPLK